MRPTARSEEQIRRGTDWPTPTMLPGQMVEAPVAVDVLNGGMNLVGSREQIQKNEGRLILNGRVRDYGVRRRPGNIIYIDKPDDDPVFGLCSFYRDDGRIYLVRVTNHSVKVAQLPNGWEDFPIEDGAISGYSTRYTFAHYLNHLFMANGHDRVMQIDFGKRVVRPLEEAPRARFITSFGDRLLAAWNGYTVGGLRTTNVAWCAFNDFTIWDTAIHEGDTPFTDALRATAGNDDIKQSPTDAGDEITGIVGLENIGVIFKERSIWHVERQAFAQAPFRFLPVISNLGCDLPYTVCRSLEGTVIWADHRTRGVYIYAPGARPQRISEKVDRQRHGQDIHLFDGLTDRYWCHATWDPFNAEYRLLIA